MPRAVRLYLGAAGSAGPPKLLRKMNAATSSVIGTFTASRDDPASLAYICYAVFAEIRAPVG